MPYRDKEKLKLFQKKYRENHRDYFREYRRNHIEEHAHYSRMFRLRHKQQTDAVRVVGKAILKGKMVRTPCFCGIKKTQAHHEDYSRPFDVVFLCAKHHREADARRQEREQATRRMEEIVL